MIYLLRHGLDDEKYVGGWSNVDLLPEGIFQVEKAARYIKDNIDANRIYSSDIKRAVTTANIVSSITGLEITYTSELRELDKGNLAGMEVNIAKAKYPEYFPATVDLCYPNGSSMNEFYKQQMENFKDFDKYENSLIVTHRGNINMIYYLLTGTPLDMDKKKFGVTHATLHELDLNKRKIKKIDYLGGK